MSIPTSEILLVAGALREVGFELEADLFRASLFDRKLLPDAIWALDVRATQVPGDVSQHARETAFRLHERVLRLMNPR